MIGVGVDFGTSNSTVAWFDGRQLRYVEVETNSPILPTAVHLSKENEGTTGAAPIERYVQEKTARLRSRWFSHHSILSRAHRRHVELPLAAAADGDWHSADRGFWRRYA